MDLPGGRSARRVEPLRGGVAETRDALERPTVRRRPAGPPRQGGDSRFSGFRDKFPHVGQCSTTSDASRRCSSSYFLALLVQGLIERELRRAMGGAKESRNLALSPEERPLQTTHGRAGLEALRPRSAQRHLAPGRGLRGVRTAIHRATAPGVAVAGRPPPAAYRQDGLRGPGNSRICLCADCGMRV